MYGFELRVMLYGSVCVLSAYPRHLASASKDFNRRVIVGGYVARACVECGRNPVRAPDRG